MKLRELLRDLPIKSNVPDVEITGIAYDSRKVQPGYLFVAIKGFETDGHKYIEKAVSSGAAAILAEEEVPTDAPLVLTGDTRKGLAHVAALWFGEPAKKMKFIGVTGTNGKTTVTYLIKSILEMEGKKCGLIGTNQNMIGSEVLETERTTPESYELQELFARMVEESVDYVIMEVSSHSLALSRVYGLTFEVGVFTNLTQDHLDFHHTMEEYLSEKAKLFSVSKCAVINADDPWAEKIVEKTDAKTITYGFKKKADLTATQIDLSANGVRFYAELSGVGGDVRLGIPGEFSVYNALAAVGTALSLGIRMESIQNALMISRSVKGRAEVVPLPLDFTVMIDYAHTPDGLENIISTVRGFTKGRVITLFGCGGDRDRTKRPKMGKVAGELSDFSIVTSDNPRTEDPDLIIRDILEGMNDHKGKFEVVTDRREAISYALSVAKKDDVVILAGKGHETYQIIGKTKYDFDERVVLSEIVSGKKA